MLNGEERLLTVEEMAKYLGVSKAFVYDSVGKGKLPYRKVGRLLRFDLTEVNNATRKDMTTRECAARA